jgi:phosphoribosylformimino-5-aminoimidazole carboxamide ribotide isomerase
MIIPCIDLMDGKVVQLRQGREKVLEGKSPPEMMEQFAGFAEIQVIDLDAAMGRGSNEGIVRQLAGQAQLRIGGGVRSVTRAVELLNQGAYRIIVGTAAFSSEGPNFHFLEALNEAVGAERLTLALDSKGGHVVVQGWKEATRWSAAEMICRLEPYCGGFLCTYVDKEGMMQGTDLAWFKELRARTGRELIAAGGITTLDEGRALTDMGIHCAIGMSIYTGHLALDDLRAFNAVTR